MTRIKKIFIISAVALSINGTSGPTPTLYDLRQDVNIGNAVNLAYLSNTSAIIATSRSMAAIDSLNTKYARLLDIINMQSRQIAMYSAQIKILKDNADTIAKHTKMMTFVASTGIDLILRNDTILIKTNPLKK
jgi:hypothetical protein